MHAAPKLDRRTVTKNIEAVLKLEEEDERRLSALHRISHKVGWFVGTVYFVFLQAAFVLVWVIWNEYSLKPFDPSSIRGSRARSRAPNVLCSHPSKLDGLASGTAKSSRPTDQPFGGKGSNQRP
jgi:hypothetical protein